MNHFWGLFQGVEGPLGVRALTLKLPGKSSCILDVSSRLCALLTVLPAPAVSSFQALRRSRPSGGMDTVSWSPDAPGQIGLTTHGYGHCSWAFQVVEVWPMASEVGALEIWSFQCLKLTDPWTDKKTCAVHLTPQGIFPLSHLIVLLGDRTKNLGPRF